MDRILDGAASGPRFLADPEIAQLVVACLLDGERRFQRCQMHSFVVMPNHVHMLIAPGVVSTKWLGPLRGFTAYRANRILNRSGTPFWQRESYDHVVRSEAGMERICRYIENNPVKAGLVAAAGDFQWSSARGNSRLKGRSQPELATLR